MRQLMTNFFVNYIAEFWYLSIHHYMRVSAFLF